MSDSLALRSAPLIYQRIEFFCFLGVISKFIRVPLFKISIESRNEIEDEIRRHYQWKNQHANWGETPEFSMMLSLTTSRFTEWLIRENGLDEPGLKEWIFCPGMLFRALRKWWGGKGPRNTPHEGLDLLLYKDRQERIVRLDEKIRIPVMFDGVIVGIINDFLGSSVIVEHAFPGRGIGGVCTIYGHTNPHKGLHVGRGLKQGDIMGTLADPDRAGFNVPAHLHISAGWASQPISYDRLNWDTIGDSTTLTLLDPLDLMSWPYQTWDDADPICRDL